MADDPNDPYAYLNGLRGHPERSYDVAGFNPAFATALANTIRQARAAGLPVSLLSGVREPGDHPSGYDLGGNSSHTYGLASDIKGLDGPNGKITQAFAKIAEANGLHNPYGIGDKAEYNHWQLPPLPLEQTPDFLNTLKAAKATGDYQNVWTAYNTGAPSAFATSSRGPVPSGGPARPGTPSPTGPTLFAGLNPDARGMRNNNPGNLVDGPWTQSLPGYKGSDGKFAIFDTPQHGAAALDRNLTNYGSKGINTPLAIASTWAPGSDNNNPTSYGARIAASLGVGPNDKIDMSDPAMRSKVTQAIALVENGPGKSAGFRMNLQPDAPATAVASAAPIGTTVNNTGPVAAAGGSDGKLPFFGTKEASDKFLKGVDEMTGGKGVGPDGQPRRQDQGPPQFQASPMIPGPGAHIPMPTPYGLTLNSMQNPLSQQGPAPATYAAAQQSPIGTSLNSMGSIDASQFSQFPQFPPGWGSMSSYGYPSGGSYG